MARNLKRERAADRLREDIVDAIMSAAAIEAVRYPDDEVLTRTLRTLMGERHHLADRIQQSLRRNWRISERARGATTL